MHMQWGDRCLLCLLDRYRTRVQGRMCHKWENSTKSFVDVALSLKPLQWPQEAPKPSQVSYKLFEQRIQRPWRTIIINNNRLWRGMWNCMYKEDKYVWWKCYFRRTWHIMTGVCSQQPVFIYTLQNSRRDCVVECAETFAPTILWFRLVK